ncbi:putative multi-domain containing protein [Aduncisulcus paluster]|uniref:Multi-domain containing protein n=1 Tax=Aduncisulcus paluster TaxID=2918883 RepID=A0ABQ5KK34_9EUKA|nr:putative multi-domain containing protein [Aduncisulcus paluster]
MSLPLITALTVFGGSIYGYNISVISPVVDSLKDDNIWDISDFDQELLTSALIFGSAIGSMLGGSFADAVGRRTMILISVMICIVLSIVTACSWSLWSMIIFRLLTGFGVGCVSCVVPMYTAENAPDASRGFLTGLFQFSCCAAQVVSYLIGLLMGLGHGLWPIGFLFSGLILSVPTFVLMYYMPESKFWLNRDEKQMNPHSANTENGHVLGDVEVLGDGDEEIVQTEGAEEYGNIVSPSSGSSTLKDSSEKEEGFLKTIKKYPVVLLLLIVLPASQQLTGVNAIILYAKDIFESVGFSDTASTFMGGIGTTTMNTVFAVIGVWNSDKIDRRVMFMIGSICMTVGNFFVGVAFQWLVGRDDRVLLGIVAISGLAVFLFGFEFSIGPLFWSVIQEILPPTIKGVGSSIATCLMWVFNLVMTLFFLSISSPEALGQGGAFFLLTGISLIITLLIYFYLPETRGKDIAAIHRMLKRG